MRTTKKKKMKTKMKLFPRKTNQQSTTDKDSINLLRNNRMILRMRCPLSRTTITAMDLPTSRMTRGSEAEIFGIRIVLRLQWREDTPFRMRMRTKTRNRQRRRGRCRRLRQVGPAPQVVSCPHTRSKPSRSRFTPPSSSRLDRHKKKKNDISISSVSESQTEKFDETSAVATPTMIVTTSRTPL